MSKKMLRCATQFPQRKHLSAINIEVKWRKEKGPTQIAINRHVSNLLKMEDKDLQILKPSSSR